MAENPARSEVLARVRRGCAGRPPAEIALQRARLASGPPPALESSDPATTFLVRALRNGGSVDLAGDRSAVVAAISRYLREHFRSNRLVATNEPRLAALPWREAGVLPRFGSARDGDDAAISYARLGVAETGAVVTYTGRGNPAAHNLLAEAHIVLLDSADLYLTLEQAWARIRADQEHLGRPRGVNFIAGPSSTADVEAQLVLGAHGPRAWHVILVGAVPPQTLEEARALAAGGS
jgi:L-lactate dehydrogenase complex protein LldG